MVDQGQAGYHPWVHQVLVIQLDVVGHQQPFEDNDAGRKARQVKIPPLRQPGTQQGVFGDLAGHEELALEFKGVLSRVGLSDKNLFHKRFGLGSNAARHAPVYRRVAPAEQLQALEFKVVAKQTHAVVALVFPLGQKDVAHCVRTGFGQFKGTHLPEEFVRDID